MSRHPKRLLHKTKKPIAHIAKRTSSVYSIIFVALFAGVGTYYIFNSFANSSCAGAISANASNVVSQAASAANGSVICLTGGSYGLKEFNQARTGLVTIRPADGAAVTMDLKLWGARNYRFEDFKGSSSFSGGYITGGSRNIQVADSRFPSNGLLVYNTETVDAGIVLDGLDMTNTGGAGGYEGRITIRGNNDTTAGRPKMGVQIKNSLFSGASGCTDGVQVIGDAYGAEIGPNNEFKDIQESACEAVFVPPPDDPDATAPHVDAIQLFGSHQTQIYGNYIHDSATHIMAPDGADQENIHDNVFIATSSYRFTIQFGHNNASKFEHNVVKGVDVQSYVAGQDSNPNRNISFKNNIMLNSVFNVGGCSGCTVDTNMFDGSGSGTNALTNKTPIYVGGSNPTTYAGWALANGSAGKGAATDGKDIGINIESACDVTATNSTELNNAVAATANSGKTICVTANISGSRTWTTRQASMTHIKAVPADGSISIGSTTFNGARNLSLEGFTISSAEITGNASSIEVHDSTISNQMYVNTTNIANGAILIDGNKFMPWSAGEGDKEGRLHISYPGGPGSQLSGVTVSNNIFQGPGCSDGIQIGAYGVVVKNNTFTGIVQGSCDPHVDSIQLYGQSHTTIEGNYFVGFTTALMAPDGGNAEIIKNNVFDSNVGSTNAVQMGTFRDSQFIHNTVRGTSVNMDHKGGEANSSNGILRDNVMVNANFNAASSVCTSCTIDYNLFSSGSGGTNALTGTPVFAGASNLNNHDAFILASNSPGYNNASDGTSRGVYAVGSTPPPSSETTPPSVSLTAPNAGSTVSGSSVVLSATATDNVAVSRVEFYIDDDLVGSDSTSAYSINWDSSTVANGNHTLVAKAYDSSNNVGTSSSRTIITNNTSLCTSSSSTWRNQSFASQSASFTVDFDSTPNGNNIDSVAGVSNGNATGFSSLAAAVRFSDSGIIDVRNGSDFGSAGNINYSSGTQYHFRMTINPVSHTYSVTVTPNGGSPTTIATNYAFRTEQATTSSFNNFGTNAVSGSQSICGLEAVAVSGSPSAPTLTTSPVLSGTLNVGSTLSVNNGSWSGPTPITYTYQWLRCDNTGNNCAVINAIGTSTPVTTNTYKASCFDYKVKVNNVTARATIKVKVTATNSNGAASTTLNEVTINKPSSSPKGDFNDDCFVNSDDATLFVGKWRNNVTTGSTYDISGPPVTVSGNTTNPPDGHVDTWDLSILVGNYGYRG